MFEQLSKQTTTPAAVVAAAPNFVVMRLRLDAQQKPYLPMIAEIVNFFPVIAWRVRDSGCEPVTYSNDGVLLDNELFFISSPNGRIYEPASSLSWKSYEDWSQDILKRWMALRKAAAA